MFLVVNRKKRSLVWKFVKVSREDPTSHVCLLCSKIIVADNNTSNSRRHLMEQHRKVWEKSVNEKEGNNAVSETESISSDTTASSVGMGVPNDGESALVKKKTSNRVLKQFFFSKKRPYGKKSSKRKQLDQDLARLIAEDFQPFAIVHHKGFQRYSARMDPRYVLPDRNTLATKLIPNLHKQVRDLLILRLKEARYDPDSLDLFLCHNNNVRIMILTFCF
jgi:hypothetical protein